MDLSLAMRFVMVRAHREASGQSAQTEHLFLGILELSKIQANAIVRNPEQEAPVAADIKKVKEILEKNHISADNTGAKLRTLLQTQKGGDEASSLLGRAVAKGQAEVEASTVLTLILESPTALIKEAVATKSNLEGDKTVLNVSPVEKTILAEVPKPAPKPVPPPEPKPVPPPVPKPIYQPEPQPEENDAVIFKIPKPGDAVKGPMLQNPFPRVKKRTTINRFTFRGGTVWAAIQYYLWGIILPLAILFFADYQWHILTGGVTGKWGQALQFAFVGMWYIYLAYGIVSLTNRRFQAFSIFLAFVVNLGFVWIMMRAHMVVQHKEVLTTLDKVSVWVIVIALHFYAIVKMTQLQASLTGGALQMKSSMFRLKGTPGVMFFTYVLRALIAPLTAIAIVYTFSLTVNSFWNAAFAIYGFLLAFDVIRMMIQCNLVRFKHVTPYSSDAGKKKWLTVLMGEYQLLFLPALGLFLIWYFDRLPMETWMIWAYGIYGVIWLFGTIALFTYKENENN